MLKMLAARAGLEVTRARRTDSPRARRAHLLDAAGVDLVLDIGANIGQYGHALRAGGYLGRIVSFEPLAQPFAVLSETAERDAAWAARRLAVGDTDGTATLNVARNVVSSSLLDVKPICVDAASDTGYVGVETVRIVRLDSQEDLVPPGAKTFMKVDVQGAERTVLSGADRTLRRIWGLEIELSLAPLYAGQPPFTTILEDLDTLGFTMVNLERGFSNVSTGRLLQVDGTFVRI